MTSRRDYYHAPDAPRATRIVPGGSAIVSDDYGGILLQKRADSGNWALPGGVMDIGETLEECVVREVREETGLDVEITGLIGIYTDPAHVIAYDDGEVRQQFNVTFAGKVIGGRLRPSSESTDVRFVDPADLDALPIHETIRLRIRHFAEQRQTPYLG